jgi:integrase
MSHHISSSLTTSSPSTTRRSARIHRHHHTHHSSSASMPTVQLLLDSLSTNPLLIQRVSDKTLSLYSNAANRFIKYCKHHFGSSPPIDKPSPEDIHMVDLLLMNYITSMYRSNPHQSVTQANHCFNGLIYMRPHLYGELRYAKAAIKGWTRMKPWKSRAPIPWNMTCIVAVIMAQSFPLHYAVATLLAFDCYLRISEITALTNSDVILSWTGSSEEKQRDISSLHPDELSSHKTLIRLAHTKTGDNKMVILNRPSIGILLHRLKQVTEPHGRLFPCSKFQYRAAFTLICKQLHLDVFAFRPHSLRHGGASHDYLLGSKIDEIMLRGRWQSFISVRRYIQSAKSIFIKHAQHFNPILRLPSLSCHLTTLSMWHLWYFLSLTNTHGPSMPRVWSDTNAIADTP